MKDTQHYYVKYLKRIVVCLSVFIGIFVVANVVFKVCFILLIIYSAIDKSPGAEYARCEIYVNETNGIRIIAQDDYTQSLPGGAFSFLATTDGGETWQKFMHFRHDDPDKPACENIKSRNEQHFWVWMGTSMGVTQDGGETWFIWEPKDSWPDWRCCNYRLIQDVEFEDAKIGVMYLNARPGRGPEPILFTKDGGVTWYGNQ